MTITDITPAPADMQTPEQLLALDEADFEDAASEDFYKTTSFRSPFMHPTVIERTWTVLNHALIRVDGDITRRAEDPDVTVEQYRRTVNYRAMVIRVLLMLEGHPNWPARVTKDSRHWRSIAHVLAEVIEGGRDDDALDDILAVDGMSVRAWLERRRIKDPSRVPAKDAA